ncbi:MAG TPA: DUF4199 domain-containing protein [Chitinophagaceae bacterium]|jgi:Mg2+/Co2+ transporter CorB|nr:DUF4199 domain-containing protein [Chitinophagaceae bacterium]
MEQTKPVSHVVAGLLIAAAVIVINLILNFTGNSGNTSAGMLMYLVIIIGLAIMVNRYGKSTNYTQSFGNLFSYGFKATAVFTIMFIIFLIIFNLMFPEFKEQAMEMARTKLEERGSLSDDEMDKALEISKKYFWIFAIGGTMLGFIIVGAIGSLLGAAITKKRPNNPFEQQLP